VPSTLFGHATVHAVCQQLLTEEAPGFKPSILDVESMIDEVKDKVVSMHAINTYKRSV
jgi:hypothetical protein